jgi:hypothetical protein
MKTTYPELEFNVNYAHWNAIVHEQLIWKVVVLFAVVRNGESRGSKRPRLRRRFDHESHVWLVLDLQIKLPSITASFFENLEDGLHHAASVSFMSTKTSSEKDDASAARMTEEVCWMASRLSVKRAALPW